MLSSKLLLPYSFTLLGRTETGMPSAVIRLRMLQQVIASLVCPASRRDLNRPPNAPLYR